MGADSTDGPRFDRNTRWLCIFQKELGEDYNVIEHLVPILHSHKPLNQLVIMLGTNDLKKTIQRISDGHEFGHVNLGKAIARQTCSATR